MGVIETRAKVSIIDGASSGLNSMASANERLTSSLGRSASAAKNFSVNLRAMTDGKSGGAKQFSDMALGLDKAAQSASNTSKMLNRLVYSMARYTVIYEGIKKLGDLWSTVVGGAYDYGNMMETNRVGMAGILASMMQINGQQLSWNQSLTISSKIMNDLQNESLKTSATASELIDTFRALLGPGLGAGMSIEQIEKFTTVGVNAVKSLGLDGVQLVQELRDLVQGGIRPASSTLATALGISDADIKKAKESSEGLYKFLMDRMKGFEYSALETNNTVKGRIDQIKEGLQRGIAEGTAPLRGMYSEALKEFGESIIQVDKSTKEWKINPEFISSISSVSGSMVEMVESAKKVGEFMSSGLVGASYVGKTAVAALGQAGNHIGEIVTLWAGFKVSKYVKDLMQILSVTREERELQTGLGRAIQGMQDKFNGRLEAQKKALKYEEEEKRLVDSALNSFADVTGQISESASKAQTLNSILESNENSITNLAKKWQAMGMSIKESVTWQNKIVSLVNGGYSVAAMVQIGKGDERARKIQAEANALAAKNVQKKHEIDLYEQESKALADVMQKEHERRVQVSNTARDELNNISLMAEKVRNPYSRGEAAEARVQRFLDADTSGRGGAKGDANRQIWKWQQTAVEELRSKLQALKLDYEVVQVTTEKFMDSLKTGMSGKVKPVMEEAIASAKVWNEVLMSTRDNTKRLTNAQIEYKKYIESTYTDNSLGQVDRVKALLEEITAQFKKAGMSANEANVKAHEFVNQVIQGLKTIDQTNSLSLIAVFDQASASAKKFADNFKLVKEQMEQVKQANADAALEFNALSNAFKIGGEEAFQATKKLLEESKALQAALNERGATDKANAVYKETVNYLQQVAEAKDKATLATKKEVAAIKEANEALTVHKQKLDEANQGIGLFNGKMSKMLGVVSSAGMGVSILTDAYIANTDGCHDMAKEAADAAMQISMISMAAEGLIGLIPSLVAGLKSAYTWFRNLAVVKALAMNPAGLIGAVGVGTLAAIAYGVSSKYEKAQSGDYNVHDFFSDAELGGYHDGSEEEEIPQSSYVKKFTPTQKDYDAADAADEEMFHTKAQNSLVDMYAEMARISEQKAKEAEDLMRKATLADVVKKQDDGGSGKASGGKSGKAALPELEYTDALGNAFWYLQHGYNVYAAAALAGNQMQEAGRGDTESIDYAADNKQGYYGSAQWGGERFKNLYDYAKGDWTDREKQLEFSDYELREAPYYKDVGTRLRAASSLEEANHIVFSQYEVPGDDTEGTRLSYAQQLLPRLIQLANKEATLNGETGSGMKDMARQREELYKKLMDATNLTIRDTKNLNEATLSVTGTQTAYDKTMQEANDKLEEYKVQIEKDKALGVDENVINGLQNAMIDYAKAMRQKAKEAQQTETMGRYDDQISAISNRNLGFGEAYGRSQELTNKLNDYKSYLQEQLNDTNLSYNQRIAIEQKLSSTIKAINDQSCYNYKEGWKQALTEISNQQINWKDTTVNLFSDIESSLANCLSSTGNFVSRMKSFFSDFAKSVLKSISQVIAKVLIMKVVTGLFGGGGNKSLGAAHEAAKADFGAWESVAANYGYASGGDVLTDRWVMVGERGPELVRFSKDAHVYSNGDTRKMLSGGAQTPAQVQVIVNNNTGTQMQARQTTSQDSSGKLLHQIILSTVGEALTTNEYGLKDAIMGVR